FFLVQRRADSEFVFDIDLALSKSEENPVYYIQYAHARICSMLAQASQDAVAVDQADASPLTAASEIALLQRLAEYPAVIALAAKELAPHHIAFWLRDCASDFHTWYNSERVLVDDEALKLARLRLASATRQVLAMGLNRLGVSAPVRPYGNNGTASQIIQIQHTRRQHAFWPACRPDHRSGSRCRRGVFRYPGTHALCGQGQPRSSQRPPSPQYQ